MIRTAYGPERASHNPDADSMFSDHVARHITYDGRVSIDGFGKPQVVRGISFTGDTLSAAEDITALRGILSRTMHGDCRWLSDIKRAAEIDQRINEVLYQDPGAHDFTLVTSSFHGDMRGVFSPTYVEQVVESAQRLQLFST